MSVLRNVGASVAFVRECQPYTCGYSHLCDTCTHICLVLAPSMVSVIRAIVASTAVCSASSKVWSHNPFLGERPSGGLHIIGVFRSSGPQPRAICYMPQGLVPTVQPSHLITLRLGGSSPESQRHAHEMRSTLCPPEVWCWRLLLWAVDPVHVCNMRPSSPVRQHPLHDLSTACPVCTGWPKARPSTATMSAHFSSLLTAILSSAKVLHQHSHLGVNGVAVNVSFCNDRCSTGDNNLVKP